jgi:hypothetical protein
MQFLNHYIYKFFKINAIIKMEHSLQKIVNLKKSVIEDFV